MLPKLKRIWTKHSQVKVYKTNKSVFFFYQVGSLFHKFEEKHIDPFRHTSSSKQVISVGQFTFPFSKREERCIRTVLVVIRPVIVKCRLIINCPCLKGFSKTDLIKTYVLRVSSFMAEIGDHSVVLKVLCSSNIRVFFYQGFIF